MPDERVAYIDGSSTGMYGYYLEPEKLVFIIKDHPCTNNQAEAMSLYALVLDLPQGWTGTVYSDSLLIVNQFKGKFQIKDPELKRIHDLTQALIYQKNLSLNLIWIPREKNIFGKKLERELAKERKKRWTLKNLQDTYM